MLSRIQWQLLASLALFVSIWSWAFWPTLQNMEMVWRGSDTYMHCYFIPLISAWLIYDRRQQIHFSPNPAPWPLLLLLPLILIWLVGFIADTNILTHFSSILILQMGIVVLIGGKLARQILFPVCYLIFMVPFGETFNPALQDLTASLSVYMLQLVGIPVFREGLYLTTPVAQFEVAEACSGLRFLIASVAIGTLFSYLTFKRWYKHLLFMLSLLVFSILANGFRAFFLIWIGEVSQMQYGFGQDHFVYGWLFFGLVMFAMFWFGGKFADPEPSVNNDTKMQIPSTNYWPQGGLIGLLLLTLVVRSQLPLTMVQGEPVAATLPSGFQINHQSDWQPSYRDGLTRNQAIDETGTEFFVAEYAFRQDKGELINWGNWLFSTKKWTMVHRNTVTLNQLDYRLQAITNHQQQQLTILSWYQIGPYQTTNDLTAKLLQVLCVLQQQKGNAAVYAVAVPGQPDDAELAQMAAKLQLIRQQMAATVNSGSIL